MENICRTVYGAKLQTTELLGVPLTIPANSTLNEKFNCNNTIALADTDVVSLKYVGIGNGGHQMVTGTNNISRPEPVQHTPRDAALYNQLPFVLREPANDLTAGERANYRLRVLEMHDNVQYVAYYLKVLDLSQTVPTLELRSVNNGVTTSTAFAPTIADLNPTPPAINPGGVLTTTGDYIAATAKVPFFMSVADINEFMNVCNIIYGDPSYAIISEICLCSGVDHTCIGNFNGASVGYIDAIGVQIISFINAFFSAMFSNSGIDVTLDVGSVEPLLILV